MTILCITFFLINADFSICTYSNHMYWPSIYYANDQYYVFWRDNRDYSPYLSLYGARVTTGGTVLDPGGKLFYKDSCGSFPSIAYDGTNFLVVFRDGC